MRILTNIIEYVSLAHSVSDGGDNPNVSIRITDTDPLIESRPLILRPRQNENCTGRPDDYPP